MIQPQNKAIRLFHSFRMLLGFHLVMMLSYAAKQARGQRKAEYGIPFFDDLDSATKIAVLHELAQRLNDENDFVAENVTIASALAALENFVQDSVRQEMETRMWSREKFGEETTAIRELVIAAYQSRFPKDECPDVQTSNAAVFASAACRLFSEIRPKPYYWLADTELPKRKELMERLNIPNDYFEPFGGKSEMTEEQCQSMLHAAIELCEDMMKQYIKREFDKEKCWWMAKDE